jgi:hypothetical protein
MAQFQSGGLDAALAAVENAATRAPRDPRVQILRADILTGLSREREATRFYQAAINLAQGLSPLPPDLARDLDRARAAAATQVRRYETFVRDRLGDLTATSGDRFAEALDLTFGRRQHYPQAPTQFFFPGLPTVQFFPRGAFDWIEALEAQTAAVRAEVSAILPDDSRFSPYVEARDLQAGQTSALAGSRQWTAFFLSKNGVPDAANNALAPVTWAAMQAVPLCRLPGRSPSVLFSQLRPGAHIPPHNGLANVRLICHLPLIVPQGCGFRVGNETRQWVEGQTWVFDDTIEHEAWNKGNSTRIILLFEVWRPEFDASEREALQAMFAAIDAYGVAEAWDI